MGMTQAEKAEELEEAEVIKTISPITWRHVNLPGRFEFQKQYNRINIDEIIKSLQNEPEWQKPEAIEKSLQQSLTLPFMCIEQELPNWKKDSKGVLS